MNEWLLIKYIYSQNCLSGHIQFNQVRLKSKSKLNGPRARLWNEIKKNSANNCNEEVIN